MIIIIIFINVVCSLHNFEPEDLLSRSLITVWPPPCSQAKNKDLRLEASQLEEEMLNAEEDNVK